MAQTHSQAQQHQENKQPQPKATEDTGGNNVQDSMFVPQNGRGQVHRVSATGVIAVVPPPWPGGCSNTPK